MATSGPATAGQPYRANGFRAIGFTFLVCLDLTISWTQGGKRVVPQHSVRRPVS